MDLPSQLLKSEIKRGSIIYHKFDYIDHSKYCLIIGENKDDYIGLFFINSNINFKLNTKQEILDLQYLLRKVDYDFLKYDSYLSCTEIKTISKSKLLNSIESKSTIFKGNLFPKHLNEILTLVRNSKVFSKFEKETFFK